MALFAAAWLAGLFVITGAVSAGEASYSQGWQAVLSFAGAGAGALAITIGATLLLPFAPSVRRRMWASLAFGAVTPFGFAAVYSYDQMPRSHWWAVVSLAIVCSVVALTFAASSDEQAQE